MKKSIKSDITGGTVSFDLSTNLVPIVDVGMYGFIDELISSLDEMANAEWYQYGTADYEYSDFSDATVNDEVTDNVIGDIASPLIEDAIREFLPSATITPTGMYHPRYYNFENDYLYFTLTCNADEYNALFERTVNNPEFATFLRKFGSDDGFISFMADDIDEFYKQEDWRQAAQVIMFNVGQDNYDYQRDFEDDFIQYLDENYDNMLDGIEYRDTYEG